MVEVQTNAQVLTQNLLNTLMAVDSVGLSLDSGVAEIHDLVRGQAGNFDNVLHLLGLLAAAGKSVRVRSLVSRRTISSLEPLSALLPRYPGVKWCLQEFTPVGDGAVNAPEFKLDAGEFTEFSAQTAKRMGNVLESVSDEAKTSAYAMLRSDGRLYGTRGDLEENNYPTVGSIITDHLADLAERLPFDIAKHAQRYQEF